MKILIIEDEKQISLNIKEFLENNAFGVDCAFDGEQGFLMANSSTPYDLIILDVMLPKKDGITVCRELRSQGKKIPIIMLTALDSVDSKITGLDTGADDYLVKPFSLRELLSRINALIRRSYNNLESGVVLQVADLTLNTKTKEVKRAGNNITLSKKHFQILELLMRNKTRVLSKQEIEEHIWDNNASLWSDVVTAHIQVLRSKVDKGFEKNLIKTIHSMGYTINED